MTFPRVVGLDLSITATGVADATGRLSTISSTATSDRRLTEIRDQIRIAIGACPPGVRGIDQWAHLAVIEDLPTHAHGAGITGMVHGVVRALLVDAGVPFVVVPPATLKKYATSRGNSPKADLRMELFKRVGLDIRSGDEVDAWWLRAMGLDHLGHPPVVLPGTHRAALRKITWPEVPVRTPHREEAGHA